MDFANQAGMRRLGRVLLGVLAGALLAGGLLSGSASAATKAPKVAKQPLSVIVEEGQSAVFEATASELPSVQWEVSSNAGVSWSAAPGATTDRLTVADASTSESGYEYRALFTNAVGHATSKVATLTVRRAPAVVQQPTGAIVEQGQSAVFEAVASGFPAPTVQWEVSSNAGSTWIAISKATAEELTVANVSTSQNANEYRAVFTNAAGKATSSPATLTVQDAPKITKQPLGVAVEEGHSALFEATASGFPTPTVQWEVSLNAGATWSPVAGASSTQLTVSDAQTAEDGDQYRAVFVNVAGQAISTAATLHVQNPPVVSSQPVGTTVEVGQAAVFEASASGFPAPSVQWEVSSNAGATWSEVAGASSDVLSLANVQASENGDQYRALFTNVAGSVRSTPAVLTVAIHHYVVLGWGANTSGQLGDGATLQSDLPTPVSGLKFVTSVAGGTRHSLALLSDGTVAAWGSNAFGQLGDGEAVGSDVPVAVEALTGVKAIAAGANHSLALLSNGTVLAWGDNESGQLGDGDSEEAETLVAVKGLTGVKAIAAGGEHSLALLSNGRVMAWGENEYGELGDGGLKSSDVPVAVQGLTGVTAIAAGGEHSLALLSNGKVMAWGSDGFGQLGSAEEEAETPGESFSDVPVAVDGVSGATAIAAGARYSLALLSDGTAMAWGEDRAGQLGDGSIARGKEMPVAVSGLAGATAIAAGGEHSLALLGNGSVVAWGEDKDGELGNGTAGEPSDVPVAVSGLSQVVGIAAGGFHDLAYGEAIPTVTGVSPDVGPLAGGTVVTVTGSNFTDATAVKFGTSNAASFTVDSPTSITAVSPAGEPATVDVTVSTPSGASPTGIADRFSYVAAPSIKKMAPKTGSTVGGTVVTITGAALTGATAVSFGSSAAKSFTVNSATSITAESPAAVAGTVGVTVSTPGGSSAPSAHSHFKYKG
jgi:alpha-tubulin suppressor-like RCC1 family protein